MVEEIDIEKCNFQDFRGPVTLPLNRVIRHTVMDHSSTSMYKRNFIEIGQTFCGRTFPPLMLLGRLGGVDLKISFFDKIDNSMTVNASKQSFT